MKKILILILLFFLICGTVQSQWVQQYQVTEFVNLEDVNFANDQTGWVCGSGGLILKTTNQGQNWFQQNSGVSRRLDRIAVVDENTLYIVGQFQLILKSTTGGTNWQILSEEQSGPSYYSTFFLNQDTGFIAGSGQYVLKTTNGGFNFTQISIPKSSWFYDMYFRNDLDGIISGDGSVYKTSDGGMTWETIWIETNRFDEISFIDSDTGYIVGRFSNQVYKTTNFGSTWDSVSIVPYIDDSYSIKFMNNDTGWIGGSFGYLLKTTNGGINWYQQDMSHFNQGFIEDIHFVNDTIGWAVGAATKILFTTNGGGPLVSISNISNEVPSRFTLEQNYPNPFNGSTIIKFNIKERTFIKIEIYDMLGRLIEFEDYGYKNAGEYKITYYASKLSSGTYLYRLYSGDKSISKKFTLIK